MTHHEKPQNYPNSLHDLAKDKTVQKKQRTFGAMKGLVIYMSKDFNAPLEDFKDYM